MNQHVAAGINLNDSAAKKREIEKIRNGKALSYKKPKEFIGLIIKVLPYKYYKIITRNIFLIQYLREKN